MSEQIRLLADLCFAFGSAVMRARTSAGWSQRELAARCGMSQATISRVEQGHRSAVRLDRLARLAIELGIRFTVLADAPPWSGRSEQRDFVHARCIAYVKRRLEALGWQVAVEVEIGRGRSRGWIDLLAFHGPSRTLLVIEVKTEVRDVGALLRMMRWYERAAWDAARRAGWRPIRLVRAVVVLATDVNDRMVLDNSRLLADEFPVRAPVLQEELTNPGRMVATQGRALAMIDPLSRRQRWLRATRADGRRTANPATDYADFARILRIRGRRSCPPVPSPRAHAGVASRLQPARSPARPSERI